MVVVRVPMCALVLLLLVGVFRAPARAQTIDDGIMLPRGELMAGYLYSHDSWEEYWEGALKRENGNIGTLTTQANSGFANFGLTKRLNLIGTVPYVWTHASHGVLHGMEGIQDLTLAAKYSMFEFPSTRLGALRGIGVMSVGVPLSDYTPDFQPLSIGLGTTRVSARFTFNAQSRPGWFVNGSLAHTWRMDVKLDRPYYFTDGQFFMTDEVVMPTTFDYVGSVGYLKDGLMAAFSVSQQWTLGGGDIRRQDMPFISNRMHFSKVGGMVMYPIPKFDALALRFGYAYTVGGRNVGQSQTFTTGVLYRFRFFERATQ